MGRRRSVRWRRLLWSEATPVKPNSRTRHACAVGPLGTRSTCHNQKE